MNLSFSSLINMTVIGSVLIGIIYALLKSHKVLARFGTTIILGCSVFIMVRLLLPFEFSFTNSVYVYKVWPPIYLFLIKDLFHIGGISISPCEILLVLWIIGSVYFLSRSVSNYRRLKRKISALKPIENPAILSLVSEITAEYKHQQDFSIVETNENVTPMIFGFKHPYIILPKLSLSYAEWDYILRHEISHYYRGHLYIKLFCEILCNLYWWNPFVYLLRKLLNNLLEMNVDAAVTKVLSGDTKIEYLNCLLKVAKQGASPQTNTHWSVTFSNRDSTLISQRVHMVFEDMEEQKQKLILPMAGIIIAYSAFMLTSFFVIVEPSTRTPADAVGTYSFDDGSCYFIKNSEETYDLYVYSEYFETYDKPFDDPNIKIYNNLEEVLINENN